MIKNSLIAAALMIALVGCTSKITFVSIENDAGGDILQELSSEGFSSETSQAAKGQLQVDAKQLLNEVADAVSGVIPSIVPDKPVIIEDKPVVVEDKTAVIPDKKKVTLTYRGRTNGDRPTWYDMKNKMSTYPSVFTVDINGCKNLVVTNNGKRYEKDGYIAKQSDVPGRGLAILAPSSCKATVAFVEK